MTLLRLKKVVKSGRKYDRIFLDFRLDSQKKKMVGLAQNGRTQDAKGLLFLDGGGMG